MAAGDWKDMLQATEKGDLARLRYHIEQGVNPNYQHPELLTTPLIVSIEQGHHQLTKFLLENGADPKLKAGFSSDTPMAVARRHNNREAIDLLKPYFPSTWQRFLQTIKSLGKR